MKHNEQFTVSKDGTRIAYTKTGSGQLIITVFGATSFKDFFAVKSDVKELSKHFTVINYDRRGRGGSINHSSWSLQKEIEDIESLIDVNGGSAYLYGHSSGAVIALDAALALRDKIKAVMIYDASYVSNEQERQDYASTKATIESLLNQGLNAKAIKTFLIEIGMPKGFAYLLPFFPGWKKMKQLAPTLMYDIALTEVMPPTKQLQNISIPTLILAGGKNPQSIKNVYAQLVDCIPNNQHDLLKDQDHMAGMKVIMPHLINFIKS